MRWSKRLRKTILTASAVAGVIAATQTLAGRPIVPPGDLGVTWREHRLIGGRQLDFRLGGGTVEARFFVRVVTPAPASRVEARFEERPILGMRARVSRDQRHWELRIPVPPRDDSTLGMTRWVAGERMSIALRGPELERAGRLIVMDWRIATGEHQDSMALARTRAALWWFYLCLLGVCAIGAAFAVLLKEKKAFTTEEVVRELIALVEGKSRTDSRLLRRYLVCIVVENTGYRRAVARLGLASFEEGRSVARRALIAFEEAATPLKNRLDLALRRLRQEAGGA